MAEPAELTTEHGAEPHGRGRVEDPALVLAAVREPRAVPASSNVDVPAWLQAIAGIGATGSR